MKVKEIERTANIAWSPASHHPIYLVTGTAAQQLDATFSTSAALEIYALNLQEPGLDMGLKASLTTEHRFNKVVWGNTSSDNETGIIVGGTDSGRLIAYDPARLLAGTSQEEIFSSNKHAGAINSMDFNTFQPNLLVSGGADSEILIWDLNNPGSPLTPGAKSQPSEEVSCVAWNRQVQNILASTFPARCVVWDLRKNEPIIKVADSSAKLKCKVVDWHPEVATQLCLASEDDQSPVVQLWDLRFATAPLKTLERHTRGVLSIAWCRRDPDLLLSCGKDSRILCWNPNSNTPGGDVVCELPTNNQWSFEVLWCPRNPAVIASASFDGHVSVYSLMGGQQQTAQPSSKITEAFPGSELGPAPTPPPAAQGSRGAAMPLQKPPKWLRKPVGATFAFGGKLVSFCTLPIQQGQGQEHTIFISQVVTEPQLLNKASQLEAALNGGTLAAFCQQKVQEATDEQQRMIWSFLHASFDQSPRGSMLSLLGYDPAEVALLVAPTANKKSRSSTPNSTTDQELAKDAAQLQLKDDTLSFETIAANEKKVTKFYIQTDPVTSEGLVGRALLTGNIASAVELFVREERWADALLLSQAGGRDLALQTQRRYLESGASSTAKLVSAVVTSDWAQVIETVELSCWKEALAAVLTYARPEEFSTLCQLLGSRLEKHHSGKREEASCLLPQAMLCFICAGNLPQLTSCWAKWHRNTSHPDSSALLQDLVEQIVVLRQTVLEDNQSAGKGGESLSELLGRYASLLASQGSMASASTYLMQTDDMSLLVLRDRIYQSLGLQSPQFPFQRVDVKVQHHQETTQPVQQQQFPSQTQGLGNAVNSSRIQQPSGPVGQQPQQFLQRYQPQPPQLQFQQLPQQQFQQQQPQQNSYGPQPVSMYQQVPQASAGYLYNPVSSEMAPTPSPSPFGHQQSTAYSGGMGGPPPMVPSQPAPPPPPPTEISDQGKGLHMTQRYPKHVQDPSVYSEPAYGSGMGGFGSSSGGYYQPPSSAGSYYPSGVQQDTHQQSYYSVEHTAFPAASSTPSPFIPASSSSMTSNPMIPPIGAEVKPGWNDPPPIKPGKRGSTGAFEPPAAIMTPMNTPMMPGPEPMGGNQFFQGSYNPPGVAPPPPGSYGVPTQMVAPMTNPQPQQIQGFIPQQMLQQTHMQQAAPEPPKEKGPIPPEHQVLQDTFEDLRHQCLTAATNPQMRRKLDDVARKLECLYDKLRDDGLSQPTVAGLHEVISAVQQGAYQGALSVHSQLVSGMDFSEMSSFMPGLKVLLQTAQQLGVYLQ